MTGIEMLLKQFGIDPEKIKVELQGFGKEMLAEVTAIRESQTRIEKKIDSVLSIVETHLGYTEDTQESGALDGVSEGR
jgi:hypothetical protein